MWPEIKRTRQREESRTRNDKGEKENKLLLTGHKAMGGFSQLKEDGIRNLKTVIFKRSATARS